MEAQLKKYIEGCSSMAVACSGGVDSVYLMDVATEVLGPDRVTGFFYRSPFQKAKKEDEILRLGRERGWSVEILSGVPGEDILRNDEKRCYFCKRELFRRIGIIAEERGIETVADGTNTDDLTEDRPGLVAVRELEVANPLAEVGFGKADIRSFAKKRGLSVWNLPSDSCLATRISRGERITPRRLRIVERGEFLLRTWGCSDFRLKLEGNVGILWLREEDRDKFKRELEVLQRNPERIGVSRLLLRGRKGEKIK